MTIEVQNPLRSPISASMPRSTSTRCLVEQANQPDLFGRHKACKATLAPPKTQVICALAGPCGRGGTSLISIEELKANSGLPGPRGNLELLNKYLQVCSIESVFRCLAEIKAETSNSPEEFVGMCGVVGFATLNYENQVLLVEHLKKYSRHASWRIRESVAVAIQKVPARSLGERLKITQEMEDNDPLVCRAIVAGLCEPKNLKNQTEIRAVYSHLVHATNLLKGKQRLTQDEDSLKKALGYCWSVALSEHFDEGKHDFESLFDIPNKNVQWILRENLGKNRLIRRNKEWAEERLRQLTSSST